MAMKHRNPLFAFWRPIQVTDRVLNVWRDTLPVETRVGIRQIGGRLVAERLRGTGFDKLVEQFRQLLEMLRIGQLADQIGGANQSGLGVGRLVIVVVGNRKPRQFDCLFKKHVQDGRPRRLPESG